MKPKKPKRAADKLRTIVRPSALTEDRILQISNDISEDMCRASRSELAAVIRYWQTVSTAQVNELNDLKSGIAVDLLAIATRLCPRRSNAPHE